MEAVAFKFVQASGRYQFITGERGWANHRNQRGRFQLFTPMHASNECRSPFPDFLDLCVKVGTDPVPLARDPCHFDLGYEYTFEANDRKASIYLYDFKSNGFFYTSPTFPFPYLYDSAAGSVVYYFPDPNNPDRYNTDGVRYSTGQIISK